MAVASSLLCHRCYHPHPSTDSRLSFSYVQSSIYGRLDIIRVANSLFDSLTVVSPSPCSGFACIAAVHILTIGDPKNLIPGNVTLSNSDISGEP